MNDWLPGQYLKFADERTRPAQDLLAQVPVISPDIVYDLGCGPGNSTALLVERFPGAEITGVDNSPAMIAEAKRSLDGARYELADLASWMPEQAPDLLFSNAAFHWVPDHIGVMARLMETLRPGGVLAVQMPDNLAEPSHRLMAEVGRGGPWAAKLAAAARAREPLPSPAHYYSQLKPLSRRVDIWHSIYNHQLKGVAGIVEWLTSTGLRPWLNTLDAREREHYLAAFSERLREAYPADNEGTVLLRFPRLFIVAVR